MEVNFGKRSFTCLDTALQELQTAEQAQEIKLSDSLPDIGRVLCAWGQPILRGKEWRSDGISFSGGMMVWILYAPEDGSEEKCIDGWIPFQMKWDLPALTPEGQIRLQCLTRFVDARPVSARKIMVRAGMAVIATAMAEKTAEVYEPKEDAGQIELLRSRYPVRLPREAGEKTFLIDEELTLPEPMPKPETLIYYRLDPKITDKKVLSGKLVFRGDAMLHILYRSGDGRLQSWDFEVPFSQYAELRGEYGVDAQADILLGVTGLEAELTEEGAIRLRCGAASQYLITDKVFLELIEDAYCPGRELEVRQTMLEVPAILENRRETVCAEEKLPCGAASLADVCCFTDHPRYLRTEKDVQIEIPGAFQTLYYGEDGSLQSGTAKWTARHRMNAHESCQIRASRSGCLPQAVISGGAIQMKAELPVELTATAMQGIPMITGALLGEQRRPDPGRPSLILCRAGEADLWSIAKSCGSTMDAIRRVNDLPAEPVPGQMLLIPVP